MPLSLQGTIEFTPTGKKPLLWVSQQEDYQEGKGVRGGIPIYGCGLV